MYKYAKIFSAFIVCLLFLGFAHGQATKVNNDPDAAFKSAKELFQKEQYSLAYPTFKYLYSNGIGNSLLPESIQLECKYYYIVCFQLVIPNSCNIDQAGIKRTDIL